MRAPDLLHAAWLDGYCRGLGLPCPWLYPRLLRAPEHEAWREGHTEGRAARERRQVTA